ncbi:hypothetical protein [Amycolatopsis sp. NPDC004079]|uniref:hypothetical protein n=1 Tax=Amycolatopsis sp. NPDC004079 TaxID=3154549 RepID=UPI0033B25AF3
MAQSSGDDQLFPIPEGAPAEVREFFDRDHRRASIVGDGRIMTDPGQVLTNIENTMQRIHDDIYTEFSIADDIATDKELMAMMGDLAMDSLLILFLVNTGMRFMKDGGYPNELVTFPLPDHYDITALVPNLKVNERQHQIAKAIFDRRSTSPDDLTDDDIAADLEPLDLVGKIEVFIILFYMWATKIGAMKNVTGAE